jgi:adenosylcobinamide-GDP ribazoletransferase
MVLRAVAGALGFLTWLPVGRTPDHWEAFVARPGVIPAVGYVVGAIAGIPFLLSLPDPIVGALFVLALYLATGLNHVDGLVDLADGVATHGDADRARAAMKDSEVGVAGVLALGLVLVSLYAVGRTLAAGSLEVIGLVIAAEVGAKLGMTAVTALGTAAHDGLGRTLSENADRRTLRIAALISLPAAALTLPNPAGALALGTGLATGIAMERWTADRLGGTTGDVFGATNEVARLLALGMGVIAWTLW